MHIDPATRSTRERYKLMIGGIMPRPIALVSTVSLDGKLNLAPFSFFTGVGASPMTLLFCPANNERGEEKDSLRNAKLIEEGGVGEFVVNVASARYIEKVATCGEPLPHGESEFELVGLHPQPSEVVRPPRVAESPLSYECRTLQVLRLAPGRAGGPNIVLGEVVSLHVNDDAIDEHLRLRPDILDLVGRMGGLGYTHSRDRFELPAGRAALEISGQDRSSLREPGCDRGSTSGSDGG